MWNKILLPLLGVCFFLAVLILSAADSFSQSRFFYTASSGIIYYNGDLNDKRLVPPTKIFNLHYQAGLGFNIDKNFDLRFQFLHGKIEAADSLSNEYDNKVRNLSFKSKVDEVSLMLYIKLFRIHQKKLFNPYLFVGYGMFWFNPTAILNDETYELQPLGTEGQFLSEGDYPAPYKLRKSVFPIGLGVNVRVNEFWKIKLEFANNTTTTDYLDDVSTAYPDLDQLSAEEGTIAAALSNRRTDGVPLPGRNRGNIKKNDNYVRFSAGIVYNPRRKKASEFGRIGIFDRLFSGKHGWWGKKGKGLK